MRPLVLGVLFAACVPRTRDDAPYVEPPRARIEVCSFLLGRHLGRTETGAWEEVWTERSGELWEGRGMEAQDGRVVFTEELRLFVEGEALIYEVRLSSGRVARFRGGRRHCHFEDPVNDFPREIRYDAVPGGVSVLLTGSQDGQPVSEAWTMETQVAR